MAIFFEFSWFCAKIELFPRNLSITKPKWLQIEIQKALSVTNFENFILKVPSDFQFGAVLALLWTNSEGLAVF